MTPARTAGSASINHNSTGATSEVPRLKMMGWLIWYWDSEFTSAE